MPESGILASGAIVSLVDTAGGASVWMALGRFQPIVTIDLRLDCYKLTKAIGFVRGIAHCGDEKRPVAQVTGTFMLNP